MHSQDLHQSSNQEIALSTFELSLCLAWRLIDWAKRMSTWARCRTNFLYMGELILSSYRELNTLNADWGEIFGTREMERQRRLRWANPDGRLGRLWPYNLTEVVRKQALISGQAATF